MPASGLRAGIDVLKEVPKSVVAAHPVPVHLAVTISHRRAVADVVTVRGVEARRIAGAIAVGVDIAIMVGVANTPAAFAIGRIRREVAGTAIGRALIGIIILMHPLFGAVFAHRIGQPLIGPAAAAAGVATGIDRRRGNVDLGLRAGRDIGLSARREAALEQSAARHRGHGAGSYDGNCRNQSLSLIHISEPTRQAEISYAVFCLKKK